MLGRKDLEILFKPMSKTALKRKRPKPKKEKKEKKVKQMLLDLSDKPKREDTDKAGDEEQAGEEEQAAAEEQAAVEEQKAEEEQKEGEEEQDKEEAGDDAADGEEGEEDKPKLENFTPESVIFFEKEKDNFRYYDDKNDHRKEEIQNYFDGLRLETLTIDVTHHQKYEGMEDLRLYIERVGRM
jgi:hypothetical protein